MLAIYFHFTNSDREILKQKILFSFLLTCEK
jgi:hypothetical protein